MILFKVCTFIRRWSRGYFTFTPEPYWCWPVFRSICAGPTASPSLNLCNPGRRVLLRPYLYVLEDRDGTADSFFIAFQPSCFFCSPRIPCTPSDLQTTIGLRAVPAGRIREVPIPNLVVFLHPFLLTWTYIFFHDSALLFHRKGRLHSGRRSAIAERRTGRLFPPR